MNKDIQQESNTVLKAEVDLLNSRTGYKAENDEKRGNCNNSKVQDIKEASSTPLRENTMDGCCTMVQQASSRAKTERANNDSSSEIQMDNCSSEVTLLHSKTREPVGAAEEEPKVSNESDEIDGNAMSVKDIVDVYEERLSSNYQDEEDPDEPTSYDVITDNSEGLADDLESSQADLLPHDDDATTLQKNIILSDFTTQSAKKVDQEANNSDKLAEVHSTQVNIEPTKEFEAKNEFGTEETQNVAEELTRQQNNLNPSDDSLHQSDKLEAGGEIAKETIITSSMEPVRTWSKLEITALTSGNEQQRHAEENQNSDIVTEASIVKSAPEQIISKATKETNSQIIEISNEKGKKVAEAESDVAESQNTIAQNLTKEVSLKKIEQEENYKLGREAECKEELLIEDKSIAQQNFPDEMIVVANKDIELISGAKSETIVSLSTVEDAIQSSKETHSELNFEANIDVALSSSEQYEQKIKCDKVVSFADENIHPQNLSDEMDITADSEDVESTVELTSEKKGSVNSTKDTINSSETCEGCCVEPEIVPTVALSSVQGKDRKEIIGEEFEKQLLPIASNDNSKSTLNLTSTLSIRDEKETSNTEKEIVSLEPSGDEEKQRMETESKQIELVPATLNEDVNSNIMEKEALIGSVDDANRCSKDEFAEAHVKRETEVEEQVTPSQDQLSVVCDEETMVKLQNSKEQLKDSTTAIDDSEISELKGGEASKVFINQDEKALNVPIDIVEEEQPYENKQESKDSSTAIDDSEVPDLKGDESYNVLLNQNDEALKIPIDTIEEEKANEDKEESKDFTTTIDYSAKVPVLKEDELYNILLKQDNNTLKIPIDTIKMAQSNEDKRESKDSMTAIDDSEIPDLKEDKPSNVIFNQDVKARNNSIDTVEEAQTNEVKKESKNSITAIDDSKAPDLKKSESSTVLLNQHEKAQNVPIDTVKEAQTIEGEEESKNSTAVIDDSEIPDLEADESSPVLLNQDYEALNVYIVEEAKINEGKEESKDSTTAMDDSEVPDLKGYESSNVLLDQDKKAQKIPINSVEEAQTNEDKESLINESEKIIEIAEDEKKRPYEDWILVNFNKNEVAGFFEFWKDRSGTLDNIHPNASQCTII